MTDPVPPLPRRLGGRLSVDFANTIEARASAHPEELLVSPERLVDWALDAGALPTRPAAAASASTLRRALRLREAFHDVVVGRAGDEDLPIVNDAIAEAGRHTIVVPDGERYRWGFDDDDADAVLWAVARDMGDLLTDHAALARVRECALDDCGWIFVDSSRNGSRRWCSMEGCGNIAKSRAFQARRRAKGPKA